jgi:hypothetical protein
MNLQDYHPSWWTCVPEAVWPLQESLKTIFHASMFVIKIRGLVVSHAMTKRGLLELKCNILQLHLLSSHCI